MVRTRIGALMGLASILLAACSGAASPSPSASQASQAPGASASGSAAAPASPSGGAVKQGGTLVVAIPGDIKRTDSALVDDSNTSYVAQNVMEGLVGLAPGSTSKLVPILATKWDVSSDGKTYTFTLREGVKFHDGTDFNADAVKANYDRWTSFPKELQDYSYYANTVLGEGADSNVASVKVDSPTQVTITLKVPNSSFLLSQSLPQFGISSPAALKAGKADNTVTDVSKIPYAQGGAGAMVGTGPFKFDKWVKGTEVDIVKNADYWNKDAIAHLDRVVFKPVSDETAILNGLQAGDIDLAQKVSPVDVENIKSNTALVAVDRGESCNLAQVGMNSNYAGHLLKSKSTKQPLSHLEIRQAIMYAINRQALVDTFYAGQAKVADNWMPLNTQYAKALNLPNFDLQKAKDLIKQSGLSGADLTIDFYYPSDVTRPYLPDPKGVFEAISNDLEAAGFTIQPHTDTWSPTYLDNEAAGKYEMWLIGWTCDWAGPDNFLKTAIFGYINGKPNPEMGYKNDEVDKTMNDALAATDEATAKTLWEKAQDLLAKDLPTVPLVNSTPPAVAQAYVKGFVGAGNLTELLNSVWLDK
ncbi:MAG TPA: ABC transporter substrate-binding protein [Candidatus Limnocylindrales bacterium]